MKAVRANAWYLVSAQYIQFLFTKSLSFKGACFKIQQFLFLAIFFCYHNPFFFSSSSAYRLLLALFLPLPAAINSSPLPSLTCLCFSRFLQQQKQDTTSRKECHPHPKPLPHFGPATISACPAQALNQIASLARDTPSWGHHVQQPQTRLTRV